MILVFSEIPAGGVRLDRALEVDLAAEGDDRSLSGPVHLLGRARPGRRGLELSGTFHTTVRQRCSRCLEPFEGPLRVTFDLTVVSEAVEFGAGERRMDPDDARLFYADRGKVDLREVVREQILLELPLKPVCGPECAGLCPTCGANRNRIECSCRSAEVDPRLAPLQALKNRGRGSP
jgi:uncharacterized protein